jgi:hypothetical protein
MASPRFLGGRDTDNKMKGSTKMTNMMNKMPTYKEYKKDKNLRNLFMLLRI